MSKQLSQHQFHVLAAMFLLISFMLGCNESMVVGNLTLIANTYHQPLSQISILVAIFAWTYAIVTPILTMLTNRFNKYWLLMALLAVFLTGTILSSFSPTYGWLVISRVITASVAGAIESLLSVIVYKMPTTLKQRSLAVACIYTGYSIASVVGIPLGTVIANRFRWQDAFIMVAVITVIAFAISSQILPHDMPGKRAEIKDQLVILKDRHAWMGIFFIISAAATFFGYYTYIRPLIRQTLHFSADGLSLILMILGVIDIIANQLSGKMATGKDAGFNILRYVYLFNLVVFASFGWLMQNKWVGLTTLFVLALTAAMTASPTQVYFMNLASKKYPSSLSLASTFTAIFYNVGIALASMTGGRVLKYAGLTSLGWNSFAYCLIATVLVFGLAKVRVNR